MTFIDSLLPSKARSELKRYPHAIFLFTSNDFKSILIPHTTIGLLQASTGPLLTTNASPDIWAILGRAYMVLAWNGLNLLTFNVTNQRLPESIAEDSVNKPWRPIASGLITPVEAKRLLRILIPLTYVVSLLWTGGAFETLGMVAMTWLYNDLEGGDESVFLRHALNGCAFALHTYASTMIAANENNSLAWSILHEGEEMGVSMTPVALRWLVIQGCIVATTIHAMDLPDIDGDRKRNRKTLPLVIGERAARVWLALGCLAWSVLCLVYWDLIRTNTIVCLVVLGWSALMAGRAIALWNVDATKRTYKMWCVWLTVIYALPSFASSTTV